MKKLLSLLLVLAMVLGMGTAAYAAYPDSTGNKYEASILKVSQLGVFEGTDGKFNPNATITRAEFAAVMVRTLGLESAALALAGTPTKFTDVPASHWASGYVNIAVAKGLSTGTSATTFSPSAPVTHAEVITMLVRGMNRDSQAVGTWPVGHIMVASQLNLMSGLTFNMNVPALRCEVAKYIDNSLAKAHMVLNAEGVLEADSDLTYLSMLDGSYITDVVKSVSTTNGTITITDADGNYDTDTFYLATGAEIFGSTLANLKSQSVQLTLNSDDEIIFAKLYTTSQVVGKVTATDIAAKTVTVNGTAYVMLNTAAVTVNGITISGDALAKIAAVKGADVVMVLDDAGKVSYATGTLLSATEEKITAKSTAVDNGKVYTVITLATSGAKKIDSTTTVIRNGVAAVAADLKIGDFVKFAETSGVLTYVDAFGNTVTGVLAEKTTVNGFAKIKIGTTTYDIAVDADGDPDTTADGAYDSFNVGAYVTVTLDRTGKFSNIIPATGTTQVRTIAGTSVAYTSTGNTYTVSTTDGGVYALNTANPYFVDPEAAGALLQVNCLDAKFSDLAAGMQIILKFDGNGKIIALDAFGAGPVTVATNSDPVILGADANGYSYSLTTNGSTAVTINNLPGTVAAISTTNSTATITWDFTGWSTTNHNGAVLSAISVKQYNVTSGAIVGVAYTGTQYEVTVRKGTTDTTYLVATTSKLTVGGVTGKTWSDLAIGQKISLVAAGGPPATISFAEVTVDTTAPVLSLMAADAVDSTQHVVGKLSEDAMLTVKIYDADGDLIDTADAFKVAKAGSGSTAADLFDWTTALKDGATNLYTGLAAGAHSLVITAVDAAGNTSAVVQVTVDK